MRRLVPRLPWAPRRVVAGLILVGVAAAAVLGLVRLRVDTQASSFLPAGDPVATATAQAASSFGGDPIVVLVESTTPRELTTGDRLSALLRLEGRLSGLPDVAAVYGPATLLNQVAGRAQDLLGELTGRRDGLRIAAQQQALAAGAGQAEVEAAGRAATAEFDRRYAPLLLQGLPAGLPTLRNEKFVETVLYDETGSPDPQWRFVLPSRTSVAVLVRPRQDLDQAATENLVDSVRRTVGEADLGGERTTVSGVPVVAAGMAGQVRHELPLLGGAAALAVGLWFAIVRWTRRRLRLVPLVSTAVATAVTLAGFGWSGRPLSLGVVAFLPILLGVGSDFMTYLARGADRRLVLTVAAATAASFASLGLAVPIRAISDLGVALGVGMLVAAGTGVVIARLLPAEDLPELATPVRASAHRRRGARIGLAAAAALVALAGWAALPLIPLRTDVQDFAAGLSTLDDARHVEQVIGSSGEVGLLVTADEVLTPDAMGWMARTEQELVAKLGDRMRPVVSPPALMRYLGDQPTQEQIAAAARLLPAYLSSSVIAGDRTSAMMSFGVRFDSAASMSVLRDEVLATVPPPPPGVSYAITGLPFVAAGGYDAVSADRFLANGIGIAAAALVLAVGLRRRSDALLAACSAVLATGAGLLAMWLAGIALNPITVGLGSLTAAVGCEFTVLLAVAARRGDRGLRRAVALAAAASATGYAVLVLSSLTIVAQFGMLLCASVGLAFLSAVLVVRLAVPAASTTSPSDRSRTRPPLVGAA
ncbi:hypothetical protein BG618_02810 [Pseudonocardia autotrophica]|nr:hypothetical protein BG618_02810 [Pseudonocardia autotrophica]